MDRKPLEYALQLLNGWFAVFAATVAAAIAAWWWEAPEALRAMVAAAGMLWLADTLSGMARAWFCPGQLVSSRRMGGMFLKLITYAICYMIAVGMDCALGINAGWQLVVATLIVVREGTSGIENTAALGFPWPKALTDRLEKLGEKAGEGEGEGEVRSEKSEG